MRELVIAALVASAVLVIGPAWGGTLCAEESAAGATGSSEAGADSRSAALSDSGGTSVAREAAAQVPQEVRDLLDDHCVRCHGGARPAARHDLSTDAHVLAYVGAPSAEEGSVAFIEPGRPDKSYLIMKIEGAEGIKGRRMPVGGRALTDEETGVLIDWIAGMSPPDSTGASVAPQDTTAAAAPRDTMEQGTQPDTAKPAAEQPGAE